MVNLRASSAWAFLNLQDKRTTTLRIEFLLLLLRLAPQHFEPFLDDICDPTGDWMTRFVTCPCICQTARVLLSREDPKPWIVCFI